MIKIKTKGKLSGIYFYLYAGKVVYVGEGINVYKRAFEDQKTKIADTPIDEIRLITEEKLPWLSDERYRRYYEARWIYKYKDTVKNKQKIKPPSLGHFLEKMFLWPICPESAFLAPTSTRRDFAFNNYFKDLSRWHKKGTNWIRNNYPRTWEQGLNYTAPLYVNDNLAFNNLVIPFFKFEDVKKPVGRGRDSGKILLLKKFSEEKKLLSRKLHNGC